MANPFDQFDAAPIVSPGDPEAGRKAANDARDTQRLDLERQRLAISREDADQKRTEAAQQRQKFDNARITAITQTRRVLDKIDEVARGAYHDGGWFETGRSGALVRNLPFGLSAGTDAYDLEKNVKAIDANSAIAALQEMRRNSPTGGAVGQVSEGEYPMLAASQTGTTIDPNMGHESFLTNLAQTKNAWLQQLAQLDPQAAQSYLRKEGIWSNPKRGSFYYGKLPDNSKKPEDHPDDIKNIMQKYGGGH